jgi:hypothetical protein
MLAKIFMNKQVAESNKVSFLRMGGWDLVE